MWYMKLGIYFEYIFLEQNTFLWIFRRFWEKSVEDCLQYSQSTWLSEDRELIQFVVYNR